MPFSSGKDSDTISLKTIQDNLLRQTSNSINVSTNASSDVASSSHLFQQPTISQPLIQVQEAKTLTSSCCEVPKIDLKVMPEDNSEASKWPIGRTSSEKIDPKTCGQISSKNLVNISMPEHLTAP